VKAIKIRKFLLPSGDENMLCIYFTGMKLHNKYYILRHGEALSNIKRVISSWPEKFKNPLTPRGREMIEHAAKKLKNKSIDIIFTSPILRAKETAQIVGKALNCKPKQDKRLREISFGIFNGQPIGNFQGYFSSSNDRIRGKAPRGESYADVLARVMIFFKEINKKYKGKNILIVSHQAPLLLLLGKIKGHSIKESIIPLHTVFHEKRITKGELVELN